MKHEVYFEKELQSIIFRAHGEFNVEDAHLVSTQMQDIVEQNGDCFLIVDLRNSPLTLDKEVRKALKSPSLGKGMIKMAMITSDPGVRMIGKIVMSVIGKGKDTQYFNNEEAARDWVSSEMSTRVKR
jgi:hypothetical protein